MSLDSHDCAGACSVCFNVELNSVLAEKIVASEVLHKEIKFLKREINLLRELLTMRWADG